jgi:hypothetical protein
MSLEVSEALAKIEEVKPKKKGKKNDAPLVLIMKMSLDLRASDVLAYFHPTLRHFLFHDGGTRFSCALKNVVWDEEHYNMEIEICERILQCEKIYKYKIWPYSDPREDEPDFRDKVTLEAQAIIQLPSGEASPLNILSELINTETTISIRPSNLSLLPKEGDTTPEPEEEKKRRKVFFASH